ncbi:hypothetical protein ACIQNG_18690 [Streptomyces sp. NPDC091377]|uniref:hypothetical protein n=1 Tax=Streptomyces sp. NPDC091377 TaxID=3365995 RepID=UPI0037FD77CF
MPPALLTYTATPTPAHLPTGTRDTQLAIAVTAPSGPAVYVSRIMISVPVGPGETSLFTAPPTASVNTNTWSPTTTPSSNADLRDTPGTGQNYSTTLIFDNSTPGTHPRVPDNLALALHGTVNQRVGDVPVRIQETSGTSPDPSTFTTKETTLMVRKNPADFYVRNFIATAPATPTAISTEFAKGASIRLQWESNGTYFEIYGQGKTTALYKGSDKNWIVPEGVVTRDTTLILVASLSGTQGGGSSVFLYDTLTLTVSDPALTPASVAVADTLKVTGKTTLARTYTEQLAAKSVSVTNMETPGTLEADTITTAGLTIRGTWGITAEAPVAMLQSPGVGEGNISTPFRTQITAKTDGFLVVRGTQFQTPGDGETRATITVGSQTYTVVSMDVPGSAQGFSTSLTLPIRKGQTYSYSVNTVRGNGRPILKEWHSLGVGNG